MLAPAVFCARGPLLCGNDAAWPGVGCVARGVEEVLPRAAKGKNTCPQTDVSYDQYELFKGSRVIFKIDSGDEIMAHITVLTCDVLLRFAYHWPTRNDVDSGSHMVVSQNGDPNMDPKILQSLL